MQASCTSLKRADVVSLLPSCLPLPRTACLNPRLLPCQPAPICIPLLPPLPLLPASAGADWLGCLCLYCPPFGTAEVVRHLRRLQELSLYGHRRHNLARLRRGVNMIRILVGGAG